MTNLIKLFGTRMKESRDLCNLTQQEAARLLGFGFENSSCLAKVELGTYTKSIDINLAIKAAQIYDVSLDFLFGLSGEWERDPVLTQQKNIEGWLIKHQQRYLSIEINAIRLLSNRQITLESNVNQLLPLISRCYEATETFKKSYPEFEDLPRFSPVCYNIQSVFNHAGKVKNSLQRFHGDIKKQTSELQPLFELIPA